MDTASDVVDPQEHAIGRAGGVHGGANSDAEGLTLAGRIAVLATSIGGTSWDDLVVRTWHVIACSTVALSAVACTSVATAVRPPGYPVSLSRILADANAQNQTNPSYRIAAPGTKVPMSEATAVRAVVSKCNVGRGTRVLAAGLVTGPVTAGSAVYWAVFVDPTSPPLPVFGS